LRRSDDPKHGSMAAYQRGCACPECRVANRDAQREKRWGGKGEFSTPGQGRAFRHWPKPGAA
jgi:hypothetical protein